MFRKFFLACLFVLLGSSAASAQQKPLPNIVLIISDDHGWEDYGFMGHPHLRTPNLDRLAKQSLLFTRGYVPSSLCCPSLASIMNGLYPHQSKITSNDPPKTQGKKPAEFKDGNYQKLRKEMIEFIQQHPTLARMLASLGYLSFQTGKWWQGHFSTGGFTHGMSHGDSSKGGRHGDEGLAIGRKTMQPIFDHLQMARRANKPFFVWYAPMLPHTPHNPPDRLFDHYKDKAKSPSIARYWAMVEWFDETCGQLLDYLEKEGLAENTIVIYVTDNGWVQNPNGQGYIRSKQSQYDAGHRTPIMIRWPGKVPPDKSEIPVQSIDIAPTLLAAAGLKIPGEMQGLNLLDRQAIQNRKAIFGEDFTHDAVDIHRPATSLKYRWVIQEGYKLILPHRPNVPDGQVELFHLLKDPHERTNLADSDPARAAELRQVLDRWWSPEK